MNEQQCLSKMVAPGQPRPGKLRSGVIQVMVTRACDKACYSCTQGSNFAGKPVMMTVKQFEQALLSLRGYWGVIGMFGGNPAMHPDLYSLCSLMRQHVPYEQRGLWCNNPITKENAIIMRETFNPAVSNLNVHLNEFAYRMFEEYWPESRPFGLHQDSRHSPPFVSMVDLGIPEEERWELISRCPINQHWSALIGVFRGELRAWFCEIAGAQSMLHQHEADYPDTGIDPLIETYPSRFKWWQMPMIHFADQVSWHCHHCSIPLNGYGHLAVTEPEDSPEQTSAYHQSVCASKRRRSLQLVTDRQQLKEGKIDRVIDYLQNSAK